MRCFGERAMCLGLCAATLLALAAPAEAQRRRRAGTLELVGDQPGAQVFVDAEPVGTMPLSPLRLEPGNHIIRVTRPGYTEYTDVFRIRSRRRTQVEVDLVPVSMSLSVATTPAGAQVFVDGQFAGETPVQLDLLDGEHSLRIRLRGYEEIIESVTAVAGESSELDRSLEQLSEAERQELLGGDDPDWYEEPMTWIIAGGSALVLATVVIIIAVATSTDPSRVDAFCASNECVLFEPMF